MLVKGSARCVPTFCFLATTLPKTVGSTNTRIEARVVFARLSVLRPKRLKSQQEPCINRLKGEGSSQCYVILWYRWFSLPKVELFNKGKTFSLQLLLYRKKSWATSYITEAFFLGTASGVEILRPWKFPINDTKQCNTVDVDRSDRQTTSPEVYSYKHLKLISKKRGPDSVIF